MTQTQDDGTLPQSGSSTPQDSSAGTAADGIQPSSTSNEATADPQSTAPAAQPPVQPAPEAQAPAAQPPVQPAPEAQAPAAQPPVQPAPEAQAPAAQPPVQPAPEAQAPAAQPPVQPAPEAQAPAAQPAVPMDPVTVEAPEEEVQSPITVGVPASKAAPAAPKASAPEAQAPAAQPAVPMDPVTVEVPEEEAQSPITVGVPATPVAEPAQPEATVPAEEVAESPVTVGVSEDAAAAPVQVGIPVGQVATPVPEVAQAEVPATEPVTPDTGAGQTSQAPSVGLPTSPVPGVGAPPSPVKQNGESTQPVIGAPPATEAPAKPEPIVAGNAPTKKDDASWHLSKYSKAALLLIVFAIPAVPATWMFMQNRSLKNEIVAMHASAPEKPAKELVQNATPERAGEEKAAIYRELMLAERRARSQAALLYLLNAEDIDWANWGEQAQSVRSKFIELRKQYRDSVRKKYGMSDDTEEAKIMRLGSNTTIWNLPDEDPAKVAAADFYENGLQHFMRGTPEQFVYAYNAFAIAAALNHVDAAQMQEKLAPAIAADQVSAAAELAEAFREFLNVSPLATHVEVLEEKPIRRMPYHASVIQMEEAVEENTTPDVRFQPSWLSVPDQSEWYPAEVAEEPTEEPVVQSTDPAHNRIYLVNKRSARRDKWWYDSSNTGSE